MRYKCYFLILLLHFWPPISFAVGQGDASYKELKSWWKSIYPNLDENIAKFNSNELEDLIKFRSAVKNLGNQSAELNKEFDRSSLINPKLIRKIEIYCKAVREVSSLSEPIDHLLLSMALGLEYTAAANYFYKNIKTESGDHIIECNDAKWNL